MIHIALTITPSYVRFCAVTMASALKNNPRGTLWFHIVCNDLPADDQAKLRHMAQAYEAQVSFYSVSPDMLEGYTLRWEGKRLSMVVFYRCLLASLLPKEVRRVIYMDCDVLVLDSLAPLWQTPLDDCALAAVPDEPEPQAKHPQRLGYDTSLDYFNGGVLLLNLDYWRTHHLEQACRDYYQQHPDTILYNDQDLLNGLCHDHRVLLPLRWNAQSNLYRRKHYARYQADEAYRQAMLHPAILHYSSRKPWHIHSTHPLGDLFYHYQALTPWSHCQPSHSLWTRLKQAWHHLPYTLGFKKEKYLTHEEWKRLK